MKKSKIEIQIRNDWFKDHIAEFEKLNDRVAVLDWYKPNTCCYYTRYVFDGSKLYVSGDIGEAVFCLTEKASIESIKDYDLHYFHGKLAAIRDDEYDFDSDKAIERLKEEIEEVKENMDIDDEGKQENTLRNENTNTYISALNRLIIESKSCTSKDGWKYEVNQVYDDLTDYDCDIYEWIFEAGDIIPSEVQAYLIGIKMAYEQLKEKETIQDK